ncbi:unnamed protein product [Lactuca virosa]|uniref:Uncharacterized protein n=1 Tax=Lactuca virosa TaxID=75947 RepID=A0AAU9NK59_9ASTR|nr:unnamed protein product [Lactuca virosa]
MLHLGPSGLLLPAMRSRTTKGFSKDRLSPPPLPVDTTTKHPLKSPICLASSPFVFSADRTRKEQPKGRQSRWIHVSTLLLKSSPPGTSSPLCI